LGIFPFFLYNFTITKNSVAGADAYLAADTVNCNDIISFYYHTETGNTENIFIL